MITLTKEWLLKTIAELEEERDAVPGAVNEDAAMALAAMKLALASLEAEPVVFRSKLKPPSAIGSENWDYTDHRQPDAFELESCVIERLYTAPPAPVSDSLMSELLAIAKKAADAADECAHAEWSDDSMEHSTAIADWERRAAMLQGADDVGSWNNNKNTPSLREAVGAIRNSGIAIDAEKILAERDALNSPVIPDGWVMVPEEPTHEMLEAGDEQFGTYDVYRRMIAASPQQEVK